MILPPYPAGAFSEVASFGVALLVGIAFGVALERGGLGNGCKLVGQFYGTDFTVIRVMFTAIVTAMIGIFVLSSLGILEMHRVAVPQTWLLPQLAGGVLFGAGFIIGGLCPGTSCVAAASGRLDGLALIAGMLGGTLLFGEVFPWLARFYDATPMGRYTLPELAHLPEWAVVAIISIAAVGMFVAIRKFEKATSASARPIPHHDP